MSENAQARLPWKFTAQYMVRLGHVRDSLCRCLLIMALVAVSLPVAAQAVPIIPDDCPAEQALYEMRADDSEDVWQLSLIPARNMASIASDLYLRLTTPQDVYWFTFSASQGYGGISVWPVTDPYVEPGPRRLGDGTGGRDSSADGIVAWLRFLALDAELDIAARPPGSGEAAPHYIILPEIGLGLWYSPSAFSDNPETVRDFMPRGVFRRSACLVESPPAALP